MKFNKIYIEITNKCNLNCSFCSKDNRQKKEMSVKEFEIVLEKIKDYTKTIYLHIKGEPLLHSNLDEILSLCDKYQVNVKITTNGTLLGKKSDVLLKHHIKQLNISLHSENNMPNYFDEAFKYCDLLAKNTPIVYRIWVLNNMKLDKISTKIVDKIITHYQLSPNIVDKIIKEKNIKISDNIYLDKDNEFIWPNDSLNSEISDIGYCLGTKTHIGILSNGDVVPCCLDSSGLIRLGNIFTDNLDDIINSSLFTEIHNGFKNNKVISPICKHCSYRKRFVK